MSSGCDWLVLIPTEIELQYLNLEKSVNGRIELCGFGPIVAAARTASLIAEHNPRRILLLGIAGAYSAELKLGSAYQFRSVSCYGIGVGSGSTFSRASDLGWKQWAGEPEIQDLLSLSVYNGSPDTIKGQLGTVCAASSNSKEAEQVKQADRDSVAEDMEAFAVAAAARFSATPLFVVRGISNLAGNRDHDSWRIADALQSVNRLALEIIRNAT